jgi:hypothetical protein
MFVVTTSGFTPPRLPTAASGLSLRRPITARYVLRSTVSMGPVATAVLLYAAEKFVVRLSAGQILRKGVLRKIRRLMRMVLEVHILIEIVQDVMEDCT